ncbi:MAG: sigma-70 family RNA polymerase sigma factor [Cellulosilyticum sp.]|nr:sigma-70 family RNA polymerase sigma factor [Cellulosilyticum sp.]
MKKQQEETTWIKEAAKGNPQAFEKLILLYEEKIYTICLRLLKQPDEAFDAAQEVCIKIWKQLKNFKGDAKLSTWIYRIAINTSLDLLRQQKKRQEQIVLLTENDNLEKSKDLHQWDDLSTQLSEKEGLNVLWQAMQELKEDDRIIIVLRDIEGYSYDEIALTLGISIGTVKSRLSRARIKLKKILEQNKEPYCSFFRHNK